MPLEPARPEHLRIRLGYAEVFIDDLVAVWELLGEGRELEGQVVLKSGQRLVMTQGPEDLRGSKDGEVVGVIMEARDPSVTVTLTRDEASIYGRSYSFSAVPFEEMAKVVEKIRIVLRYRVRLGRLRPFALALASLLVLAFVPPILTQTRARGLVVPATEIGWVLLVDVSFLAYAATRPTSRVWLRMRNRADEVTSSRQRSKENRDKLAFLLAGALVTALLGAIVKILTS